MLEHAFNLDWKRLDRWLLLSLAGLMTLGLLFVYSATRTNDLFVSASIFRQPFVKQIVFYGGGLLMALLLCLRDYQQWARWSYVFYAIGILLLLAVLIPGIGLEKYGARRWIDLGISRFQPSEFAKLFFILAFAQFLSRPQEELRGHSVRLKALGLLILPFGLVLLEPDLGSALMFLPTALVMLYIAGAPRRFIKRLVGGAAAWLVFVLVYVFFVPSAWKPVELPDYQKRRLMVYFGVDYVKHYAPPNATPAEKSRLSALQRQDSYNVRQAMISVGSGGLTGKGWQKGIQNVHGYLPRGVAHNDFIFSVIAEESGLMGSVAVVVLYTIILLAGLRIAAQARDRLGKLLATGIVVLLFSQVFVNIGMNIRLMPVTGVPLPLLSYGGSSILMALLAIGLLQNIRLHQRSR